MEPFEVVLLFSNSKEASPSRWYSWEIKDKVSMSSIFLGDTSKGSCMVKNPRIITHVVVDRILIRYNSCGFPRVEGFGEE